MTIPIEKIRELRERTGAGVLNCKKALEATDGDIVKSIEYLRKLGIAKAETKLMRKTDEGIIASYIHPGARLGVLVELNCETDFVAKTENFKKLAKDIAMQIAATNPISIRREDIAKEMIEREMTIYRTQVENSGKPESVIDKVVEGKLNKFFKDFCLLEQPFVKDSNINIEDYIKSYISKLGENITIKRFARFRIGEEA
ncbi:MAG: translation elongation factor Ts [Candidatus Cloacimonadota bacterium]|nr:MAG: translation elongation factor Ts [Candidatus Cloacimonadota bacterium]